MKSEGLDEQLDRRSAALDRDCHTWFDAVGGAARSAIEGAAADRRAKGADPGTTSTERGSESQGSTEDLVDGSLLNGRAGLLREGTRATVFNL
jgi:hypothetical protein